MWLDRFMDLEDALRLSNSTMIGFDLALATGAIAAPAATLRALGHDEPSPDARHLFRRCGPIWLTFAAAHAVADRRGEPRDWWALAWLRGTEIATDVLWSASPAVSRPGAKAGLWFASASRARAAACAAWHRAGASRRSRRSRRRAESRG
jgi:hypothetical protein